LPATGEDRSLEKLGEEGRPSLSDQATMQASNPRDKSCGKLGFTKIKAVKIKASSKQFEAIGWGFLLKICQLL